MPDIQDQILLRVTVNVHDSPSTFGDIQIAQGVDLKGKLTARTGEIILKRLADLREQLIADLLREGRA
jgi:hypothetical protein